MMRFPEYYLKFADEAEWDAIAWVRSNSDYGVVVVGTIYSEGVVGELGEVIVEPVARDGFHVNVIARKPLPAVLEPYLIAKPGNLYRTFP